MMSKKHKQMKQFCIFFIKTI